MLKNDSPQFKEGDDIYIVDSGRWGHKKEIDIQKRTFDSYTKADKSRILFTGITTLEAASWAISSSIDEATKFAVAYLIKTEEFKEHVTMMDGTAEYHIIEKEHPELIIKYMSKVVEQDLI